MVNYLKPEMKEYDIKVTDEMLRALVRSGRLRWSQQADPLAIRKALAKLLHDLVNDPASL